MLAYDVGTSGVKAVLVHPDRGILAARSRSYPLHTPRPGWAEQDGQAIRAAIVDTTRDLLDSGVAAAGDIAGIAVTGQMFSLQPTDEAGEPRGPMLSWLDQRAAAQAERLMARLPADAQYEQLGGIITAKDIVSRVTWLQEHAPETWAATRWLLDCKEAVVLWLSGAAVTDAAGASSWRLTDPATGDWEPGACELLGVPMTRLARVAAATDVAGPLTTSAAASLGLPAGMPVFVGAGDVPASQLGSGALRPGDAHLSLGTAVYLGIVADRPLADPNRRMGALAHALPEAWILWLEIATGGGALSWIGRALSSDMNGAVPVTAETLERLADSVAGDTDDLLFAPWLTGERVPLFDDMARGAFVGLSLHHTAAHLVRAVMEGVAFQIRWALDYGAAFGVEPRTIRVVGGGGMGNIWIGIIADTLGIPVEVVARPQDAAAMGVAALAFVGLGVWPDANDIERLVRVERVVRPDASRAAARARLYPTYQRLHGALEPIGAGLVAAGAPAA